MTPWWRRYTFWAGFGGAFVVAGFVLSCVVAVGVIGSLL